jgi:hypothetical protein
MKSETTSPINIGSRRELFIDELLVESLDNVRFKLHRPIQQPIARSPLKGYYSTVVKMSEHAYKAWYREIIPGYDGPGYSGNIGEITCMAESNDGYEWNFPDYGIMQIKGKVHGNAIFKEIPFSHNFSPFIDPRSDIDPQQRFKCICGHPGHERPEKADGMHSFVSPDGIHWKRLSTPDKPAIGFKLGKWIHAFDSQNVAFWSEVEQQYLCFFRTYLSQYGQLRTIFRSSSPDFIQWSEPVAMDPNLPGEELYTSQTHPYCRAPHIYIALPTRYMATRGSSTDILFMALRAGEDRYSRLFIEAFIAPGLNPAMWGNRSNYVGQNVIATSEEELSIYHCNGSRYTIRTDGFISLKAGASEGEFISKPFIFEGDSLELNISTTAAGSARIEIQSVDGQAEPGFDLDNCIPVIGDKIATEVQWEGKSALKKLNGIAVRLRIVMCECDLYSFKFNCSSQNV